MRLSSHRDFNLSRASAFTTDEGAVVRLEGSIDVLDASEVEAYLSEIVDISIESTVLIDLTCLQFIDSSGLSALVGVRKHSIARQVPMEMREPIGPARKPFEITGLDRLLFAGSSGLSA